VACDLFDDLAYEPRRHSVQLVDVVPPWTPRQVAGDTDGSRDEELAAGMISSQSGHHTLPDQITDLL
jgi:hypothetical protein